MSDIVEKTKQFISSPSQEEGIKGLIRLQADAPQKMKHIPRLACLSLMEMGHDWQNIRKFIVEWKLVSKFGKDLAIRMRKRVGQDPGTISDENQTILRELDRLNDKNWRQFSPKKNFTDYTEILTKNNNRETIPSNTNPNIGSIPVIKEQKQKRQIIEKQPPPEGGIFSRLSQIQKNDRNSQKQITSRGVFSKQIFMRSQLTSDKLQSKNDKPERLPILKERSKETIQPKLDQKYTQETKKIEGVNSLLRKIQPTQPRQTTPSKEAPKKIISLKYGNERDKGKEEIVKDQFSFSAVKSRQVQALSNKKQIAGSKGDQFNDSFLNFTNDQKNSRVKGQEHECEQKNENILEDAGLDKQFLKSNNSRLRQNRNLYTEQQLGLIEMQIPVKNYIKAILKAEGKSGIYMLKNRLSCS